MKLSPRTGVEFGLESDVWLLSPCLKHRPTPKKGASPWRGGPHSEYGGTRVEVLSERLVHLCVAWDSPGPHTRQGALKCTSTLLTSLIYLAQGPSHTLPLTPLPLQASWLSSRASLHPTPTPRQGPRRHKLSPEASYLNQPTASS